MKNVTHKFGKSFAPIIFMGFFATYVFLLIILATACFHFYYLNMLTNAIFLVWSFYNGANFYMESFSRKYEKQLAQLKDYE